MRHLKAAGLFAVDFIFGDDWTMAVIVVFGLLVAWGLAATAFPAWVIPPLAVVGVLAISVFRAIPKPDRSATKTSPENPV
jgi:hypothetical protein